ncbi:MAG TPA: hypothetical protein VGG56_09780 [Terracidiphilus sp.]|jgi:hypothetical protein
MTTDLNPNPANEPTTFPPKPTQAPAKPGLRAKEEVDKADQIADHLAHKGVKVEQDFDKENSKPFSK